MERPRRRAAVHDLQDRRLDLDVAAAVQRLAHRARDRGARVRPSRAPPGARSGRHSAAAPASPPTAACARPAAAAAPSPVIRHDVGQHRQLAALGRDDLAVRRTRDRRGRRRPSSRPARRSPTRSARQHDLQLDVALAQRREAELAGVADEDDPAGDADLRRRSRCRPRGRGSAARISASECVRGDVDRERRALRVGDQPVVLRPPDPHLLGQLVVVRVARSSRQPRAYDPSGARRLTNVSGHIAQCQPCRGRPALRQSSAP